MSARQVVVIALQARPIILHVEAVRAAQADPAVARDVKAVVCRFLAGGGREPLTRHARFLAQRLQRAELGPLLLLAQGSEIWDPIGTARLGGTIFSFGGDAPSLIQPSKPQYELT